jgi:hypothetical protein
MGRCNFNSSPTDVSPTELHLTMTDIYVGLHLLFPPCPNHTWVSYNEKVIDRKIFLPDSSPWAEEEGEVNPRPPSSGQPSQSPRQDDEPAQVRG